MPCRKKQCRSDQRPPTSSANLLFRTYTLTPSSMRRPQLYCFLAHRIASGFFPDVSMQYFSTTKFTAAILSPLPMSSISSDASPRNQPLFDHDDRVVFLKTKYGTTFCCSAFNLHEFQYLLVRMANFINQRIGAGIALNSFLHFNSCFLIFLSLR